MGEFADKYNGDIQACLRGLQSEQMGRTEFEIDRDMRKRKWAAAQEKAQVSGPGQGDQARAAKNSKLCPTRLTGATPHSAAHMMPAMTKRLSQGLRPHRVHLLPTARRTLSERQRVRLFQNLPQLPSPSHVVCSTTPS